MSLLARLKHEEKTESRSSGETISWQSWMNILSGYDGGSLQLSMRNAASKACIRVLATSLARTPFDLYRATQNTSTPMTSSLLSNPSGVVAPDVWRFQVAFSLVTDGNAFGRIVATDRLGYPTQIETISPTAVGSREVVNGIGRVTIAGSAAENLWPHGPIWHVPGVIVPAGTIFGYSPLTQAAKTIGTSLAIEDFANGYFSDGAHPTTVVSLDDDPGQEVVQTIKDRIFAATKGSREPLVIGGAKIDQLQSDPNQTLFIEIARFEIEQTARHWGVPPSMIYAATSGQNVTYANVTQADLHYLKHSLDDYLVRVEYALTDLHPKGQIVRANRNVILRADVAARYGTYEIALGNKFMTVNEVRKLEDLEPFTDPQYDEPGVPGGVLHEPPVAIPNA